MWEYEGLVIIIPDGMARLNSEFFINEASILKMKIIVKHISTRTCSKILYKIWLPFGENYPTSE